MEIKSLWRSLIPYVSIVLILAISFASVGYNNSQLDKRITEAERKTELNLLQSNRRFCGLFQIIIDTGRPSPFLELIKEIYNSPEYKCAEVKKKTQPK